jgi:hypothetical protein
MHTSSVFGKCIPKGRANKIKERGKRLKTHCNEDIGRKE